MPEPSTATVRPGLERAPVRGGVDPVRRAGDDVESGARERATEVVRDLPSERRAPP